MLKHASVFTHKIPISSLSISLHTLMLAAFFFQNVAHVDPAASSPGREIDVMKSLQQKLDRSEFQD